MKAIRAYGPRDYRREQVPLPSAGAGQVLLRVLAAGLCSSDTKMYAGSSFYWGANGRVRSTPVVPGHEFVGEVLQLGDPPPPSPPSLRVGDVVVVEQISACRKCWFCRSGRENKCDDLRVYGQAMDGAMAELVVVQSGTKMYKAPPELAAPNCRWKLVFAEPLAVSVHAVERAVAGLKVDEDAAEHEEEQQKQRIMVVSGCGAIGLGIIAASRRRFGAALTILAVDTLENRLEVAQMCGADRIALLDDADTALQAGEALRSGCDVYMDASGSEDSVAQGFRMLRKRGTFVAVSVLVQGNVLTDWNAISAGKELTIVGVSLGCGCWPQALEILADPDFPIDRILTHRVGFGHFEAALQLAMKPQPQANCIKVVLDPTLPDFEVRLAPGAAMPAASSPLPMTTTTTKAEKRQSSEFRLQDALVWVTGSSRGIGRAIAERLSILGAMVVIHGSSESSPSALDDDGVSERDAPRVQTMDELAKSIAKRSGNEVFSVVGDLCSGDSVQRQVDAIIARFGRDIDALVCCAGGNIGVGGVGAAKGGVPPRDDAVFVQEHEARAVIDRNLLSSVLCCQRVAVNMMQNRCGRILLIGSVAGAAGRAQGALYATAKAAQHAYGRCLAAQLRQFGVCVNCIAPGASLTRRYVANLGEALQKDRVQQQQPGGGGDGGASDLMRYALPRDTADVVAMMLSDNAKYISGQVIRVDGGEQLFAA